MVPILRKQRRFSKIFQFESLIFQHSTIWKTDFFLNRPTYTRNCIPQFLQYVPVCTNVCVGTVCAHYELIFDLLTEKWFPHSVINCLMLSFYPSPDAITMSGFYCISWLSPSQSISPCIDSHFWVKMYIRSSLGGDFCIYN